jgi:mycothiol synthase
VNTTSAPALTTFAHDLSFVALGSDGDVLGLLLTLVDTDSSEDPDAYVWVLGVPPASRGRGTARALLTAHPQAVRAAGVARRVLDVATDGPDEGLALFTGLAYRRRSASVNFVRRY